MTENAKTITFVLIGLLAIVVGLVTRPSSAELDDETLIGQDLTKEFASPEEAKRLRIVRFNEDTATLREFEVAEQDGLWSIPSKNGYPADAARQMAEAATSLMDRKILAVASKGAGDHEEFGVVDPLSPKLEVGQKGVGTRVAMSDVHGTPLVDLIVGKAVKDAEGQRYVREAGRDIVYVIEIDPAKLSTDFEDWIEKDLLKLNAWDLQQVQIKDYSADMHVVMTPEGRPALGLSMDPRSEMTLAYNDTDSKWSTEKLRKFDPATESYSDVTLAEDEEVNTESLNGLKTALDDLQIVDVARKPQGLSNDLKAGADFMNNVEALQDLVSKGFIPAQSPAGSGAEELISSYGEVIATMKNGTEYVLRFGNLTNAGGAGEQESVAAATPGGEQKASDGNDVNRYLFVMARFNENAVQQPELEKLPELPANESATAEGDAGEVSAADGETSEASEPAETAAASESQPSAASDTEQPTSDADSSAASEEDSPASTEPAVDEAAEPASSDPTDEAAVDESADEAAVSQDGEDGDEAADSQDGEDAAATTDDERDEDVEAVIAERKRIEQENQRKLDEYQQTLDKGRENVKELNLRFGDWYFVVADDVFNKVRLGLDDVVKKKAMEEAAGQAAPGRETTTEAPASGTVIPGLPPIPGTEEGTR